MLRDGSLPPKGYQGQIEAMAVELGVDLDASVAASALSQSALERMMQHCAACPEKETCTGFLQVQHGLIKAPPSYCVDRKLIMFLCERITGAKGMGRSPG
ncbi:MAG: DUF6455 family protein [Pseudorhodobacter sp.]|nr:DUF6455 family protein [Pseudorhodobacter sp.]